MKDCLKGTRCCEVHESSGKISILTNKLTRYELRFLELEGGIERTVSWRMQSEYGEVIVG